MDLLELRRKSLTALLLVLMALSGCSTSGDSSEDCKDNPECIDEVL